MGPSSSISPSCSFLMGAAGTLPAQAKPRNHLIPMTQLHVTWGESWCRYESMVVRREGGFHSLVWSPASHNGSHPRGLVNPASLEGHSLSAATAREGAPGKPFPQRLSRMPGQVACQERVAVREREAAGGHGVCSGLVMGTSVKPAVDAGRKSRVPGLEVVPSCLSSLSRKDLALVPEEGRGAPSESARLF